MVQANRSKNESTWKLVNPFGRVIKHGTHSDCWLKLLEIQPRSAYHATTQDGWKICSNQGSKGKQCKNKNCGRISIYKDSPKICKSMKDRN